MKKIGFAIAVFLLFLLAATGYAIDTDEIKQGVVRLLTRKPGGVSGSGTGFFITENGWLVTNSHVITDAFNNRLEVVILQGTNPLTVVPAKIVMNDPAEEVDLALLKAELTGMKPLPLGDADRIKEMDEVIAVGFPGAADAVSHDITLDHTFTNGIVSSIKRSDKWYFIQTNVALNPGNSGGPLLNRKGQVVGINTLKARDTMGISYAIPVEILKEKIRLNVPIRDQEKVRYSGTGLSWGPIYIALAVAVLILLTAVVLYKRSKRKHFDPFDDPFEDDRFNSSDPF
jgi:serine protease Do